MQAFEGQCEAVGLAVAVDPAAEAAEAADMPAVTAELMLDVLAALTNMALRSKRRQADLDASLRHAGLTIGYTARMAALDLLRMQGCVDNVVELNDGGVLLSVTAAGLERLGGVRPR